MSDFNPIELAKSSKTFCIMPWIHQYVGPPGDVKPCCVYDWQSEIGSLKKNTLAEIWNNERTRDMRIKFLTGKEDSGCTICNNRVNIGDAFYNYFNDKYFDNNPEIRELVASTKEDGTVEQHRLYYIDVRFNNLCNFKCRTCSPHYSTSWIQDHKKLHPNSTNISTNLTYPGKTESQALEEILPHLEHVDQIYFAGGEPLMQKEHYEILNRLIEIGRFDVHLKYNTNFSTLNLKKYDNVIEYWKKFKRIDLMASIDGSHEKGEYWRSGTVWNDIVENRKLVIKECPHIEFFISYTLSWPNAQNLIEFHKEWLEQGLITDSGKITINSLDMPPYYSLKNIPDFKKAKIEQLFREHMAWLKENHYNDYIINRYETAIKFMYSSGNPVDDSLREFSKITKKLDEIRGENFFNVYPEHNDILEYIQTNGLDV